MQGAHTLELLLSWLVTTTLLFTIVIVDERRMSDARLERAWPPASRNAAIVAFGVLALVLHFARTRGDFKSLRGIVGIVVGLAMGIAAVILVGLVEGAVLTAFAWAAGLPMDD